MEASKYDLAKLSLIESAIINILAIVLAIILYIFTSDFFVRLTGINITLGFVSYSRVMWIMFFVVLTGVLVTSFITSASALGAKSAQCRQRNFRSFGSQWLVGLQFFISCFLVICSIMVTKQIHYMVKADLGVKLDHVVVLKGAASTNGHPQRSELFNAFRDEVIRNPGFVNGTATMNVPGQPLRYRAKGAHR